jgi:hypothetical protein
LKRRRVRGRARQPEAGATSTSTSDGLTSRTQEQALRAAVQVWRGFGRSRLYGGSLTAI